MTVMHHLVSVETLPRVVVLVLGKTCYTYRIQFLPSCEKLASITKSNENKGVRKCFAGVADDTLRCSTLNTAPVHK